MNAVFLAVMALHFVPWSQEPVRSPAVEEHIHRVIQSLPPDSTLRSSLVQGARGNGVRYPWMDEMEKMGIKQATLWFDLRFNSKGQPQKVELDRVDYFSNMRAAQRFLIRPSWKKSKAQGLKNSSPLWAWKKRGIAFG